MTNDNDVLMEHKEESYRDVEKWESFSVIMNNNKDCLSYLNTKKTEFLHLLVYVLSVVALLVFLYGFFPLKYSSKIKTSQAKVDNAFLPRHVDKLAFIVIDALRNDFVVPKNDQNLMPFTLSSILEENACYKTVKAHSPTVTLPRLKAITSGALSTFIDVILNFMAPALEEDNFINIASSSGLKLVFYGDDTWLKLFPNSFIRSEGTHSFYTFDYYEVDNNVTRHIDDELKKNDWDIIILHYLGLDHIGHTEGPSSPLIKSKLLEMDKIIKKFNDYFKKLEKSKGLKTMLILTGDHGMKDSGSHGGVTLPEVIVPLVSVGNPCFTLPGWPEDHTPLQIDLAPTLSIIFGLPIPANSMGKIIPGLLHYMSKEDVLKNLEINRLGLHKFMTTPHEDPELDFVKSELEQWLLSEKKNEDVGTNITRKYFQALNNISQKIVTSNSDFKLLYLYAGVILLWSTLIYFLFEASKYYSKPQNCIHWFFFVGTILHGVSLLSSSLIEEEHQTWYFLWITFCVISIKTIFGYVQISSFQKAKFLIPWITTAFMHRFLRKLNQTGDKWAFLPDIKSYLYTEQGKSWLCCIFLLGIGMVFMCALLEKCQFLHLITFGICLLAAFCYRVANDTFKLQYLNLYPSSRGYLETLVFWSFLSTFILQTIYNETPFYLVWLVFSSFYLRPHNIILLPVQVLISKMLGKLFYKSKDLIWNNIAHIWLGNVFYFYQGNGNSLSNVDVAAGFVGVQTYYPIYSGLMVAAHYYNGYILSFILSPKVGLSFAVSRLIPLTLYCTVLIFQLNHLFIWTVFSPKLLFEASLTLIFLILMTANYLFTAWKTIIR